MDDFFKIVVSLITNPVLLEVFTIVLATMVINYFSRKFFDRLEQSTRQSPTVWDDALLNSVRKPLAILIWVLGFSWAAELISAEAETDSALTVMIDPVRYIAVVGLFTFFLSRFIQECESGFIKNGADVTTAHAIGKLLRISVFITAALTVLQTLGISISGILAFGGVGGIAVGFAAKDILANFFGGLMIYLDRPFAVGDWIRSPDREIEGTVELIGWRLTVIRTFDSRPLYIPNSVFASIALENPSRMQNRRIYETIGVRYADVSKVKQIVDDVRSRLQNHEEIDPQRTLIVNLNGFAPSSVDFFVYTFTKTTDWVKFHSIKERILLEIYAIIESHGAEVAFPTSTIHIESTVAPEAD
ncbi:MAG: mechanosensitive ion channel family protein [bacterium]|nr:mechanosensitive ion channel family protein [Gammaproteobacteria bacterium]